MALPAINAAPTHQPRVQGSRTSPQRVCAMYRVHSTDVFSSPILRDALEQPKMPHDPCKAGCSIKLAQTSTREMQFTSKTRCRDLLSSPDATHFIGNLPWKKNLPMGTQEHPVGTWLCLEISQAALTSQPSCQADTALHTACSDALVWEQQLCL